ncbi:MAG: polymer-forming cytoskeletal protein [Rhodobacteraceae bacterium]|nr:polymer-forming cytoskeletal protein [Paracoccaceae bacterium]
MFASKEKSREPVKNQQKENENMPEISSIQRPTPSGSVSQSRTSNNPSIISKDLKIVGNLQTPHDILIEGKVEGDISARVLTVKETSEIEGHIRAEEAILEGFVKGEVRGAKIRLNKSARVQGDIIHGTIAIEAGAHFEGTVKRTEEPLGFSGKKEINSGAKKTTAAAPSKTPAPLQKPLPGKF